MDIETRVWALLAKLTLDQKIELLSALPADSGDAIDLVYANYNIRPIVAGALPAFDVEGIRFTDGPRGVVMGESTAFPVAMARGASWDPLLETRIGDAIGVEARSQGANLFAGIVVNLLRHPAWGRAQECYGEDSFLTARMGVALLEGAQRHVMGCVKHYACNSIEDSRFKVDVQIDERVLHEVYLPHFKACIDAGAASVMSAYNKVNGTYCGHNHVLLTEILKEQWGFDGFVMSDFVLGIYDGVKAVNGGMDLEMPILNHFAQLGDAVRAGTVPESRIDDAAARLLRQQFRFALTGEPERYGKESVASTEHLALAREAAVGGMVLLQNDVPPDDQVPLLPLAADSLTRIGLIGRLIDSPNIGDEGSSMVRPPHIVTAREGLMAALPGSDIVLVPGADAKTAAAAAGTVDVALVVVGYSHEDEGENIVLKGGDRQSLLLRPEDEALLLAVAAANPRTVAVVIAGSAIVTENWRQQVPAILMAWYPGMEGGHALADVLLGRRSPGGKLPCSFPVREADLPPFDSEADSVTYDLYHGYRKLDRDQNRAAFAFGFGLSYTTFKLGKANLSDPDDGSVDELLISVDVTNTGSVAGSEVIQVYASYPESGVDRPPKELKGFKKIYLAPGQTATVTVVVDKQNLGYWDRTQKTFALAPGSYTFLVGTSSRSRDLQPVEVWL